MAEQRPTPEDLLRQVRIERREDDEPHGKLKIFFGYAAGVGKTYAMLEAAHQAQKSGVDVIAGYIEPHTRPETLALLDGLEQLPPLRVQHKGITLNEFDLDAAIARRPELILVDELAHTNSDACRHRKRYQDIEELLKAGIDVYTTVNVQHIESLNDIVASITGVLVRERIPDSVFDDADQVELVDIEPDDLIERLNRGKIYRHEQAERALGHFFTRENLVALREIALRRTADRVNKTAEKQKSPIAKNAFYTEEHILICLSSSPSNAKVIRTAARMANAFHGAFTALFVETPDSPELKDQNRSKLRENLKLAEQLGARVATVYGDDVPYQISEYAKVSGVSKIVVGRSNNKRRLFSRPALVERLTRLAPNIDIYIIPDGRQPYVKRLKRMIRPPAFSVLDVLKALGILTLATLLGFIFDQWEFSEANIITIYLLGVLSIALVTRGRIYSTVSSVLSVLIFNFFFTEPRFSLEARDPGYPLTFLVMFLAAFMVSTLTTRVKKQARQAALKAYRTEVLLETSQKLQRAKSREDIYAEMAHQMIKLLNEAAIVYPVEGDQLGEPLIFPKSEDAPDMGRFTVSDERAVAEWAFKNNKYAGATTSTLPGAKCLYLAVRGYDSVLAVVAVAFEGEPQIDQFDRNMLIAMLGECGLALEKEQINETKNEIAVQARQEQLRANLLRAISHDLRTPLTSISGNAGILMENAGVLCEDKRQQLYTDIYDDSMWLINLVENLLAVTKIENGTMSISLQPELLEEVIQEALQHINRRRSEYNITVSLADDLLMAKMDSRLIIQVFINIVDNAIKYTPPGSTISISARRSGRMVEVEIADSGNGIPDEAKAHLFDMFYTADNARGDGRRGLGLGLALCKSIVGVHGGSIAVKDNKPHGAVFCFTLLAEELNVDEQ